MALAPQTQRVRARPLLGHLVGRLIGQQLIFRIRLVVPEQAQLLPGHTKLESTVRYLGIGVEDFLEISEQTEL